MTNDPDRAALDDADFELDALFATMKRDQAPADTESRLLQALAAGSVVGAAVGTGTTAGTGTLVAKVTLGSRAAGLLKGSWWLKLGAVGLVSGGVAATTQAIVHAPAAVTPAALLAPSARRAPAALSAGARSAGAPSGPVALPVGGLSDPDALSAVAPSAPALPASLAAPAGQVLSAPLAAAAGQAPTPGQVPTPDSARREPLPTGRDLVAPASPALAAVAAPGASPAPAGTAASQASNTLQQEISLLRDIKALVDEGRCAQARPLIEQYRSQHGAGQLAHEVAVVAARCAGR